MHSTAAGSLVGGVSSLEIASNSWSDGTPTLSRATIGSLCMCYHGSQKDLFHSIFFGFRSSSHKK